MLICGYFMIIMFLQLCDFVHAYINLALNRPAWQPSNNVPYKWFASAAVDGNRNQDPRYNTCAIIQKSKNASWRVDLGEVMKIHYVDIYYRYENLHSWYRQYKGRMAGFFLYVSNTTNKEDGHLCFHEIQSHKHPLTSVMSIPCVQYGRYVIYYNERRDDVVYPSYYSEYLYNELCEVEVYACDNFLYGTQCAHPCGNCLNRNTCNPINGLCPDGCLSGWRNDRCHTGCLPGTFGINCKHNCSVNCNKHTPNPCDKTTGKCTLNCNPGWQGNKCDIVCDTFYYGTKCKSKCGKCTGNLTCHHVDGFCLYGCAPGWQGDKCDTECHETFYGENCKFNCSSQCVNRTCHSQTGDCRELIKGEHMQTDTGSLIGGVVCGILVLIAVLSVVTILFVRRRTALRKENSNEYADIDLKNQNDKHIYSTTESRYHNLSFIMKQ